MKNILFLSFLFFLPINLLFSRDCKCHNMESIEKTVNAVCEEIGIQVTFGEIPKIKITQHGKEVKNQKEKFALYQEHFPALNKCGSKKLIWFPPVNYAKILLLGSKEEIENEIKRRKEVRKLRAKKLEEEMKEAKRREKEEERIKNKIRNVSIFMGFLLLGIFLFGLYSLSQIKK